jgi:hypothetical protein
MCSSFIVLRSSLTIVIVRNRVWILVDCSMLLAVVLLQVWQLTGVPIHEWLAVALLAAIVAHLLVHWSWVETRGRRIRLPGTTRTRINFGLNALLFISMTIAMVTGFAISKVIMPLHLAPAEFLKWHDLHETSSRVALGCVALHLALNWDVLFGGRPAIRAWLRPIGAILWVTAMIGVVTLAIERIMPAADITMVQNGKVTQHAQSPADIATLRPNQKRPNVDAAPEFLANCAAVTVGAVIGRKILKLQLD